MKRRLLRIGSVVRLVSDEIGYVVNGPDYRETCDYPYYVKVLTKNSERPFWCVGITSDCTNADKYLGTIVADDEVSPNDIAEILDEPEETS